MKDDRMVLIGQSLFGFQAALQQTGSSLGSTFEKYYYRKWTGDALYAALSIRTTFVNAMHSSLRTRGC